ncbi:MAG: hypothetical protein BGO01_19525 [Armatimonadetes bacterium 55-13]|nr:hypothetical protein [Armatimonadota bacterium]OJU64306.1 MAG: hypothetical protein BGO01_19525 [Armatimonadetes bacterium 55-13]
MGLQERFRIVSAASNYLVVSSFLVLLALLLRSGGVSLANVAIGTGIILIANFVFVMSGLVAPEMMGNGRIQFPMTLTLPIVFTAWLLVVFFLAGRTGNPLESTVEPIKKFENCFRVYDLAILLIAQFLSFAVGRRRHPDDPAPRSVDSQ